MAMKAAALGRIGKKLNIQQKIHVFKSTVESHLNYWSSTSAIGEI